MDVKAEFRSACLCPPRQPRLTSPFPRATDGSIIRPVMKLRPGYDDSHLVVAAIRILIHRDGRLPTPQEIADLLGVSPEKVNLLVHQLRGLAVLKALEGPFELRLDIGDIAPLETLPKDATGPSIKGELADFKTRDREKKAEMERMFREGDADRRRNDRVARLEEEFSRFRPRPGSIDGLFKPSGEGAGEAESGEETEEETDRGE